LKGDGRVVGDLAADQGAGEPRLEVALQETLQWPGPETGSLTFSATHSFAFASSTTSHAARPDAVHFGNEQSTIFSISRTRRL